MQKAFKMFDADGNGFITKSELKDIMGGGELDSNDIQQMINDVDKNGDG